MTEALREPTMLHREQKVIWIALAGLVATWATIIGVACSMGLFSD